MRAEFSAELRYIYQLSSTRLLGVASRGTRRRQCEHVASVNNLMCHHKRMTRTLKDLWTRRDNAQLQLAPERGGDTLCALEANPPYYGHANTAT